MNLEQETGICKKKARELRILSEKIEKILEKMENEEVKNVILEIQKVKKYNFTNCQCSKKTN